MADERRYETVRDPLSEEEIRKAGETLAAVEKELQAAREERKATVAEIAGRMNSCAKRIAELSDLITSGYFSHEVEVLVAMDTPTPGMKRVIRVDKTGPEATVREEPMTFLERQGSLNFMDLPDDRPEPNQ